MPQSSERQASGEQAPFTLDMSQVQEAIASLSKQYLESQEQQRNLQVQMMNQQEELHSQLMDHQREWQKQLMEQQLEQGSQFGKSINMINQRQAQQQEAIQKLIHMQAHQATHIHEMHRKQREHMDAFDEYRAFQEGVYLRRAGYDINTQARLGYLVGQLPVLNPGIRRYEEVHEELAWVEKERA
ncbi:involucrin-like [Arachis ipaensis]|uniref:involucrin-like n=1 Tax=Arachis ipaensis TaxID=130454 RepID=UPI0007AF653F|nr:involucrin-like [Arachis ipaensis]XP_025664829.1 involucrin-like [Arachis hypogaea]